MTSILRELQAQYDQRAQMALEAPREPLESIARPKATRTYTGEALERIIDHVARLSGLIAEIAASTQEQAAGLQQVNTAVNQMDHVTQQNASMVEESTAASFALASEAQQLTDLIGRFEIGAVAEERSRRQARGKPSAPDRRRPAALHAVGGGSAARRLEPDAEGWEEF